MEKTQTIKQKILLFIKLVLPVLVTQIGLFAMNFLDTVMSGHSGPKQLAGVALGSSIWVPVFTGLSGILMALTPIVSQYNGAGKKEKVPYALIQSIYLAFALSFAVIAVGLLILNPLLNAMNLDPQVREVASGYLRALSFGMIPLFLYNVLRCFIDALGRTRVSMLITLTALPVNALFNYLLIFGKWGFPELGGVGSGYASALTYWFIALLAFYIIHKKLPFSDYQVFSKFYSLSISAWKSQLKIGLPIGFSIFFETSIFAAVTLLMSSFNTATIAAHQSALNFASFLYMLPLSISFALTIAVGFEVGAHRYKDAKQYSYLGIGTAVILALLCAAALLIFPSQVAGMYSNDSSVIKLTKHFLLYAVFFQLSDAIAAPIQGALRGYKDVNVTLVLSLISYWVIGLPVGYVLANYTALEAYGYWVGLITGLAMGAVTLYFRLAYIQQKQMTTVSSH
ncbi:MATE family efflux transporter [Fictibacillus sp. KIGAM418]|uniref:Probable multidrug resistance protein NorM n=1 Tax=Fictibacillus marinisediminis TaxID=2878389 RepID=A0A9X1XAN8_9BACL|nr:MATE family efflux transporter [Fictibacillus marinisediminis]MCK6257226.1 MATE family efflux transporter [Fictibacillus marinisediminis]